MRLKDGGFAHGGTYQPAVQFAISHYSYRESTGDLGYTVATWTRRHVEDASTPSNTGRTPEEASFLQQLLDVQKNPHSTHSVATFGNRCIPLLGLVFGRK